MATKCSLGKQWSHCLVSFHRGVNCRFADKVKNSHIFTILSCLILNDCFIALVI